MPAGDGLVDQPTAAPTRKVAASGAIGLLVVLVLATLGSLGVDIPGIDPEELPVGEAFVGLMMFLSAYLVREKA